MTRATRFLTVLSSLAFVLSGAPRAAGSDGVLYELRPGSFLVNDCLDCDRLIVEEPLAGTFLLKSVPSIPEVQAYELSDIDWHTTGATDYKVTGTGSYTLQGGKTPQTLSIDVEVNGETGIKLSSGPAEVVWPWPVLDIKVNEETSSTIRIYRIQIAAAPVPTETVAYELRKGSIFVDDCLPCARPTIPIPITGKFLLGTVDSNPLFTTWRIDGVEFQNAAGDIQITGFGACVQGGEVVVVQEMVLEITVSGGRTGVLISSGGRVGAGAILPDIEIQLDEYPPLEPIHAYSIHLVAAPQGEMKFRRGDSNGDGEIDVSDAVRTLFYIFIGGVAPDCLDAADSNGDLATDLSDAVFALDYLFLAGKAPPEPGPLDCGPAPGASLGCGSYLACP